MGRILASVGSKQSTLVFQLVEYKGTRTLDIRKHYVDKDSRDLIPTKKGISLADKSFEVVQNVISEFASDILEWLGGGTAVSTSVAAEKDSQRRSRDVARCLPREYVRQDSSWKSPDFFDVLAEGGSDKLVLNQSHPFVKTLEKLLTRVSHEEDFQVRKSIADEISSLITLLLVTFDRAQRLFDGASAMTPDTIFDTLRFNWGSMLGAQLNQGNSSEG